MTETEKNYKRIMLKIGISLLVFLVTFFVLNLIWSLFYIFVSETRSPKEAYISSRLVYAVIYALSFFIPTLVLCFITRNEKKERLSKIALPPVTPCYIMIAIVSGIAFAYLNRTITGFFDFGGSTGSYPSLHIEYSIWIELLVTALMPGIFEELFFRGAILSNLLPYGKAPAIVISSVFFGLMHQNSQQFLYTTMAGIVLAWIAVETRSLLCGMIAHFMNNAYSVFQMYVVDNFEITYANFLLFWIELALFAFGLISALILIFKYYKRKKKADFAGGMFEKELVFEEKYRMPMTAARMLKLSFPATVIIFVALAGVSSVMIPFITV